MVDLVRDRALVQRCQDGDGAAFAELYTRYHARLLRFCQRRLHDPDDAQEAAQEAFARAWRALPRFAGERRFYPWLTVIAANVCTDMLRRRSRVIPMDDLPRRPDDCSQTDLDEALLREVDVAMASEALTHLSERHQRILRLRESSGWSAQRIAEFEGLDVPAVDSLLWRARQAFKREFAALADTGGRLSAGLGIGVLALRGGLGRIGERVSALTARLGARLGPVAQSMRGGPGAVIASLAVAGAAVGGGAIALTVTGADPHQPATVTSALTTPDPAGARSAASGTSAAAGGHGAAATGGPASAPSAPSTASAGPSPSAPASGTGAVALRQSDTAAPGASGADVSPAGAGTIASYLAAIAQGGTSDADGVGATLNAAAGATGQAVQGIATSSSALVTSLDAAAGTVTGTLATAAGTPPGSIVPAGPSPASTTTTTAPGPQAPATSTPLTSVVGGTLGTLLGSSGPGS